MWYNFSLVYLFKEEKMRKTIITICAFVALFGFAVSGAMAQTWTWGDPAKINNLEAPFSDFRVDATDGLQGWNGNWVVVTYNVTVTGVPGTDTDLDLPIVDSVAVPPFAFIDTDTVFILNGQGYLAVNPQPFVPDVDGEYKYIAAGTDGTLYVIFEDTGTGDQYVLVGTSDIEWDTATVRFTPRSLNLGSNGNWVTCKISGLTGHTWDEVDLGSLCIVGINDTLIATPICVDTAGPSNTKNSKKMMVKFDRKALADEISAQIEANPPLDPTSTKITVAHSDGTLNFYGDDTIKTKVPKKPKKK
jgi:hypothetical protein